MSFWDEVANVPPSCQTKPTRHDNAIPVPGIFARDYEEFDLGFVRMD